MQAWPELSNFHQTIRKHQPDTSDVSQNSMDSVASHTPPPAHQLGDDSSVSTDATVRTRAVEMLLVRQGRLGRDTRVLPEASAAVKTQQNPQRKAWKLNIRPLK